MKVTDGYVVADSRNLPSVNNLMLMQYMCESDSFNSAAVRGTKTLLSSRDTYVETAIGYVEVRREGGICFVRCRITPEHRVHSKMYAVLARINEAEEIIADVKCEDCAASEGGCKHSVCFIMWLIKRTEEPSVTSVQCYWKRPKLSEAVSKDKFVLAKDMGKRPQLPTPPNIPDLLSFLAECTKRQCNSALVVLYNTKKTTMDKYSLFDIILDFNTENTNKNISMETLKNFAESKLTDDVKKEIEQQTRQQANSKLWHTLRQGRITASNIFEASRCNTDGVLVQSILGGYKVPETKAIKRGKLLEDQVVRKLEEDLKVNIQKCGLMLISPFIGASPDGLCDDFTVEIKCPSSTKSMNYYVKNNLITKKFKAQTQIQMHAAGKKKALFCVADPMFETNEVYYTHWLYYDKLYVDTLLKNAESFWRRYIFEKMISSTTICPAVSQSGL